MENCKEVSTPFAPHFKLSKADCPSTDAKREYMDMVPYANVVGSLMYAMLCTRIDLAYPISNLCRFMSNVGKRHWEALKMGA